MKQWKLILVALLSLLLVCTCMSAMATSAPCTHKDADGNNAIAYVVTTQPTCTAAGEKILTCSECNITFGQPEAVPALGHDLEGVDWTEKTPATCSATGVAVKICWRCNEEVETKDIDKLAHTPATTWEVKEEATCTKDGVEELKCTVCQEVLQTRAIPNKGGHKTDLQPILTEESTCLVAGMKYQVCTVCQEKVARETLPISTEHTGTIRLEIPTCAKDGRQYLECTVCGETIILETYPKSEEHTGTIVALEGRMYATCTEDGYTPLSQCDVCLEEIARTVIPATGHNFDMEAEAIEKEDPTCLTDGWAKYECINMIESSLCGETTTVVLPLVGHKPADGWTVTKLATCKEEGEEVLYCLNAFCDNEDNIIETRPIAKTECIKDNLVPQDEPAPIPETCEKDGLGITYKCPLCDSVYPGAVIPKTGHDIEEIVTLEPTCTKDGLKDLFCKNDWCDFVEADGLVEANVVIPSKGHTPSKWIVIELPTPEKDGMDIKYCLVCDEELDRRYTKYAIVISNSLLASEGPSKKDIIGGRDWARVTPIDLSVEGTIELPLIASNQYVVGKVIINIAEGNLTVKYVLNSEQVKIISEALYIFANAEALKAFDINGTDTVYAFDQPINIAETFGGDTKVILVLEIMGSFDILGAGVDPYYPNAAGIAAMKLLVD